MQSAQRVQRDRGREARKQAALRYILDAWEEALHDGIEPEMLANAALFAALADLVASYGEDAVAKMTGGLSRRIQHGEFTLNADRAIRAHQRQPSTSSLNRSTTPKAISSATGDAVDELEPALGQPVPDRGDQLATAQATTTGFRP